MSEAATTRWSRIETLFHQAAEVDTALRDAFIEEACQGDLELRAELDSLLSSADQTLAALRGSVAAAAGGLLEGGPEGWTRIGAYRLIRTLGQGGMGTVYLGARDDDQYSRTVAIKVLRAGLSHRPELQLLFRTERQILADFDHPNIARMLDGGITPDGSPYLVMEYVDGIPIDAFCLQCKLALDDRVRLFRTLCAAVEYAHRHLVIHRDIKPLNVLVTEDGSPKLLDFGIAKLIHPLPGNGAPTTAQDGERLLTPAYASPEQLLGKPVTTATDVYALGVLLFELLTGELPFAGARTETGTQTRAVSEDKPLKPSAVCLMTHHLSAADARRMRGDLDCIILKALDKDPERRYASASPLLAELDRYFTGYAVEAVESTAPYRVGKFVRRHRIGTALTMLAASLTVAFVLSMAWFAQRATRGEALARREQEFLSSIFKAATPEGSKGENITARQLLDQAAGRLEPELASDPRLQAELTESIGQSYVALGLYDRAQPLLERALRLAAQSQGESSPLYADDLSNVATNDRLQGRYATAEPLFRHAVTLNQALYGQRAFPFAHSLSNLGECLYWEDKNDEAEQILRRALAIERPLGDNLQDGTRNYLALNLERKGAYPEAAALLREATDISGRLGGKESDDYLTSLHNFAGAQIDMGDLDGAAISEREVLATRQKIWGHDHPDTAYPLNNLGWILLEQGRWQEAEPLLRENVEITRKVSTVPGPRYAGALANLGRALEQKGDFAGAAADYDQALRILTDNERQESWNSAKILIYQSQLELDSGHPQDAIRLATRALRMQTSLGGDSNPQRASGLLALGLANLLAGDPGAAEDVFRGAFAIRQRTFPPSHSELLIAQVRLSEALLDENRPQDALALLNPAVAAAEMAPYPLPIWRMAELRVVRGLALRDIGGDSEATASLAADVTALGNYNQPAVRIYLMHRVEAPSIPRYFPWKQ
jgi:eukaryotic-like serine/threonine-protein kinase